MTTITIIYIYDSLGTLEQKLTGPVAIDMLHSFFLIAVAHAKILHTNNAAYTYT